MSNEKIAKFSDEEKNLIIAKVRAWDSLSPKLEAESSKLKASQEAMGRHLDAEKLLRQLRDAYHIDKSDGLLACVETILADIPAQKLDDAEIAGLKRRHASQFVIKQIVTLRGHPLSAANEALIQNKLEAAMAAIAVKEGAR
jgi:hypothetical protein